MKNSLKILAAIFIFSCFVFSQNKQEGLFLLQSLERPSCDPIISQLDTLAVELQKNPDYFGYIVVKGGENPFDNILYQRAVGGHFKQRGVNENRFSIILTKPDENKVVQIETWISSDGTKPEWQTAEFSFDLPANKSTLFNEDIITLAEIDGKETYIGGCDVCCLHAFYLGFLAEFLEANPKTEAHLRIYNGTRNSAVKLKNLILAEAEIDYKDLVKRLKFKFDDIENVESNVELSDIINLEVRIVPQKPEAVLINEFENACSEIIALHYDSFLVELHNDPTSTGYIVFNGEESQDGTNLRYIQHLSFSYPRFRGFNANRVILIRGENQSKMRIQFWKVPPEANLPEVEKNFENEKISSTKRFQKTYAELTKLPGSKKEELVDGFYAFEGCDFAPNLKDFAKILSENDNLTGYLVIYAAKKKAKKIQDFVIKNLTVNHKIPKNRLKIISGGKSEEPIIELWFVPKTDAPPQIENNPEK